MGGLQCWAKIEKEACLTSAAGTPGRGGQADLLACQHHAVQQPSCREIPTADRGATGQYESARECRRHDELSGHSHIDGTGRHGAAALGRPIKLELPVHHGSAGQDLQRTQLGSGGASAAGSASPFFGRAG